MFLEQENQILREKNLILSLQVESMLNLQNENDALMEMLDFKKNEKFVIMPAKVVNKGIQPNLLSIIIDRGIGISLGAGLTLLSFSGLKCINSNSSSYTNTIDCSNITSCPPMNPCGQTQRDCITKKCSKVNMNLGLSSLLLSGVLITYKYIRA